MDAKPHLRLMLTLIDPDIAGLCLQNTQNVNINVQGITLNFQFNVSCMFLLVPPLFHFVWGRFRDYIYQLHWVAHFSVAVKVQSPVLLH